MKKKLLTLILACSLVFSNTAVAFAEGTDAGQDTTTTSDKIEDRYAAMADKVGDAVTGTQAVTAANTPDDGIVILDVRHESKHANGVLNDSICIPVFDAENNTPDTAEHELAKAFLAGVAEVKAQLEGQEIYVLCNGGQRGARAAAVLLGDAGLDISKVHTITYGASGLEVRYDFIKDKDGEPVTGTQAVTAANTPDDGIAIIDVRHESKYANGVLNEAIFAPVFYEDNSSAGNASDPLAVAFLETVTDNAELSNKEIYILCNGGARGARAATVLLGDAGYDLSKVHTITDGASGIEVRYDFIKNKVGKAVTGAEAVEAVGNKNIAILDVRYIAKYEAGHLAGSIHVPVFDADNNTPSTANHELAKTFLAGVKDNADLAGKEIYVLCNGGQRGARAAAVLLGDAGYDITKVHTITGGAGDADVKAAFVIDYNYIAGQDAVTNAKLTSDKNAVIIDVRATEVGDKNGYLDANVYNVFRQPLFNYVDGQNVVSNATDDELAVNFKAFLEANASALEGKEIYILCNSGSKGAAAATKLLKESGYASNKIFTITNGAKGLDMRYAFLGNQVGTPVTSTEALEAHASTSETAPVIIDVRATGTYGAGHLKGVKNVPVFTSNGAVQTADDELAKAFVEYFTTNKESLEDRDIYLLCNSGQSGARAATVLLKDAGYDLSKVHTITGGYNKNEDIKAAAIYVSDTRAINATMEADKLIIDVRNEALYEAGHLEGSLSLPLFDANNGLDSEDALALEEAFVAYVEENMVDFEDVTIYILCNSGNRGALKAISLLAEYDITNVFIIEGGATSLLIQDAFVTADDEVLPDNEADTDTDDKTEGSEESKDSQSTTPKTGDSAPVMTYVLIMCVSLAAILISRKKLTK